ncbi:glycosyltransferase family 1 protein [Salinicoccus siamensis]|uniref:Glycosyltransferase family 1 protein n=1 Tax=Salinicoccus siamensis TaxID=381830 RepID=A0ABV5Z7V9_9STAP
MQPFRILHVFGGLDSGGAESRIMDIYREIDRTKIQFDFLVHTNKKGFFEDEINDMGGRIYRVPRFDITTIYSYFKAINNFFKKHSSYKVVHGHILSTAFIYQRYAKKYDIPVRIAHSRCGSRTEFNFKNATKELFKRFSRFYVTHKFAVSKIAGDSAFGSNKVRSGAVEILPNAIKTEKYKYDQEIRENKRQELKANGNFLIGHIGRFTKQKNHDLVIDVFHELNKQEPNTMLVLVGDGELKSDILTKVNSLGLSKQVIFTGVRDDVHELLQAIDLLLFPSFYEGLPGVVLEAQAAGLPCIVSNKITKEVKITDLVTYVSLEKNAIFWSEKIRETLRSYKRESKHSEIIEAGYDIKSVAKWYQNFYLSYRD